MRKDFEITYSCGHTETVTLRGKEDYIEWKAAKMAENVCDECADKAIAERRAEAARENKENGFAEIIGGSPKQNAWAEEIRRIIWVKFKHEADDIMSVLPPGSFALFTGAINLKKRLAELDRFRTDSKCLYLIANKVCGGYGLNLQFCHKAIYYNNDFNFATRAQAEDRIHRIGQTEKVEMIDLVSDGKIDQRIVDCLDRKENLSDRFKYELKEKRGREFLI